MSFKCFLSEDEISSKSYIIVLQPERNKYLKWELPSPQATVDLIKSENIKLPVKSYTIFKLNCASAIRESHNFITDTSEVEIIKTTIAIWNCAEESIKEKYNQLNMDLRDLESPAPSGLPEETSEVVVSDLPLSYREELAELLSSSFECKINLSSKTPFYNSRYSEESPALSRYPSPIGLINLPFPPTINIDNLVPVPRRFDGDKPPRSPNAFLIYRKAYVKELHSRRINLRMTQISSMASESWKQEPDSVKAEYKRLEEEAKKRYNEIWTSEQRRRQHRKHQQQSLFIDSKPTNELGLSNLTQTPPQTAIDINQLDFSQSSLWPHQAISPLQNLTPLYNSNYYSEVTFVRPCLKTRSFFYRPLENVSLYRVEAKEISTDRIYELLTRKEGSPGAYSWNLSQQLDKDVFGAIKRRIEELEKTKVAKSNQEGYCENCGTKYTQIMTVDAERKCRFQIKTQRLVRERESADEEDQIFNNQRFEQVNANNNAKMGSEVWQNLHEGIDCPKEFYKKVLDEEVYCHNDRLVKDTSNAQEANQQTCRQCKNRFMREQNYISDYVRDAHQKHEFHKKQIYEHEPKESGEVGSMNKISNNHVHDVHSMNDINGDQVMVHESPHQKQIYEHNFHNQHEPINQTFNLDNTINEAICEKEINAIKNVVHDVQFPNYRFLQSHIYQYKPKDDDEIKWCCEAIQHFSIFIENAFPYLRFHSWSFFKIGFQNGIRKKLAFTFRRRKIYYSRNKFINRRNRRKYRLDHRTNDNNDYK